ncbi:hypothetical protein [Paracoccus lutimaris]|uniref:hypothetical protein n=1 Tax=Paracoccus lutimaris TaxID=1490030 RepID=UPI0011C03D58|nr:hypothetical protein [Paracoccus lutimaris]
MPADLSAWPTVHLGFHQFRTPPDFTAPDITATIGSTAITVLRNQAGRAQDIVLAQEDVGEIIRHMTVNDWEVFVTSEDMGLIVSSYTYLVLGLYRVGNDVVMTRDSMSRTDFPKGDDAEKWLFHSLTRVAPVGPNARAMGFVFDGLFFETAYFDQAGPDAEAMFSASAVRAEETGQAEADAAASNNYQLYFIIGPADQGGDDRPLVKPNDIADVPGVKVENSTLKVDGADAGFSRVTLREGDDVQTWFDATVFWPVGSSPGATLTSSPGATLTSAHLKFVNAAEPEADAEGRALGLLTSISRRR